VRFVYSGFRPLLCPQDGDPGSSTATREDHIEISRSGLIRVKGGKLTTARLMAIRVLDRVIDKIGGEKNWPGCRTHELSIGGTNEAVAEGLAYWVKRYPRLAWYLAFCS
jgi:glycerol-3-phosphate dehydrogenase